MSTNKNFCDVCTKSISLPNWSHHIKTKKNKNKEFNLESITPDESVDTNPTVTNLSNKIKKQLKSLINKEKYLNQYYCDKCEKWISKSNKSKHDHTNKHQVL
jgi:hypothetical protein